MAEHNSSANSWPESDAVEEWWRHHRLELKEEVSKTRMDLQNKINQAKDIFAESCQECETRHDGDCYKCPVGKVVKLLGGDKRWMVQEDAKLADGSIEHDGNADGMLQL